MIKLVQNFRLYLAYPGNIAFYDIYADEISSDDNGAAIKIYNDQLSVSIFSSNFKQCKSTANYGGSICIQYVSESLLARSCFSHNYCNGCPDIVVWGGNGQISNCTTNSSTFYRSSTKKSSSSCSNFFCSISLTLNSLNSSSMEAKTRSSGMCFGTYSGSLAPITQYCAFENCTTADYIIEIIISQLQPTMYCNHFIISNCGSWKAAFRTYWFDSSRRYLVMFKDSILKDITCGDRTWTDDLNLLISFENSVVLDCPPTDVSNDGVEWTHKWPNVFDCYSDLKCTQMTKQSTNMNFLFFNSIVLRF